MRWLISLLLCTLHLYSQPYVIRVIDSVSEEPLPYVPVYIAGRTAITNESGTLTTDTCNVVASVGEGLAGYTPARVAIPCDRDTLLVSLVPVPDLLKPVVISALKEPLPYEKVPASVSVIPIGEQLLHPDVSPLRAIQQVSGVEVTGKQVSVRGMSGWAYGVGARVRLVIDGLPLVMSDAGDIKWFLMPSIETRQIEFIKGGASALYGSAALDGIISITTREPVEEGIKAGARAWMQIAGTPPQKKWKWWEEPPLGWRTEALLLARKGRVGGVISADLLDRKGYRRGEDEQRQRFFVKFLHIPYRSLRYSITVQYLKNLAGEMFFWSSPDSPYIPATGTLINSSLKQLLIDPGVEWLMPAGTHSLKLRYLYTHRQQAVITHQLDYSFHWKPSKTPGFTAIAGTYLERGRVDSSDLFPQNHITLNIAPYLQFNSTHQLDTKRTLRLFVSTRMEHYRIDTLAPWLIPVFRMGASIQAGRNMHLRASLGEGIRFPTVAELFTFSQKAGIWLLPNPHLQPEHGWTADLGFFYEVRPARKLNLSLESTFFYARFQNMVEYSYVLEWIGPTTLIAGFKPYNTEQGTVYGVEAELLSTYLLPAGELKIKAGATRTEPINSAWKKGMPPEEKFLKFRYRWMAKVSAEVRWHLLLAGIYYRYHSPMMRIDPALYLIVPQLSQYMEAHCVCVSDLSAYVGVGLPHRIKVFFYISNLLNTPYMYLPGNIAPPTTYNIVLMYKH